MTIIKRNLVSGFVGFLAYTLGAQTPMEDLILNTSPPGKTSFKLEASDNQGNSGYLPVVVVKGSAPGPVFSIVAGVHGYEYPPIIATQELLAEIDATRLKGTLIIVPIANRASFFGREPFRNPQDGVNLNNAFPGDAEGTITQRLADIITRKIIPHSTVFLDIHGGDACEDLIPFVCYYNNTEQGDNTAVAKRLSDTAGFPYVVSYPYTIKATDPAKYAFKQAVRDGKIALSIEGGKLGNVEEEVVALIKKGVYRMLAGMGMWELEAMEETVPIQLNSQTYVRSKVTGIFHTKMKAGDAVKKDELLGYATDEFGNRLEEYRAPNDGIILYHLATPPINKGETVACVSIFKEE